MTQDPEPASGQLVFLSQAGNRRRDVTNTLSAVRSHIAKRSQVQRRKRVRDSSIFMLNSKSLPEKILRSTETMHQLGEESTSPFNITIPQECPGSSDTTTRSITVAIKHLLSFHQAHLTQGVRAGLLRPGKVPEFRAKFLRDSRNILDNNLSASAFIARYAALIANITKRDDMSMMALEYKNHVSEQLRSTMTSELSGSGNLRYLSKTCWAIYSLMASELYAGNTSGASFHGEMLFHLLQPNIRSLEVTAHRLVYASLWQDTQRAQITLTLPTLDTDSVTPVFPPVTWERRSSRGACSPLEDEVQNSQLRSSIDELRQLYVENRDNETLYDFSVDFELGQPSDRVLLIGAKLAKVYNNLSDDPSAEENPFVYTQIGLALATIYWYRRVCKLEDLGITSPLQSGKTFTYAATALILDRMRGLFDSPRSAYASQCRPQSTLWTLYVAAWAEQTYNDWRTVPSLRDAYFNVAFIRHAATMGIYTWSAVQNILSNFLYIPGMTPFASAWFEVFRNIETHGQELDSGNNLVVQLEYSARQRRSPTPSRHMLDKGISRTCFYEPCLGVVTWFLQPPWTAPIDPNLE